MKILSDYVLHDSKIAALKIRQLYYVS